MITAYQPQPGTIPHRVIAWLRTQPHGSRFATAMICEELEITAGGFSTMMTPAKKAGMVKAETVPNAGKTFFWSLGGEPEQQDVDDELDEPLVGRTITVRPGPLFPGVAANGECTVKPREFRVLLWEGQLLATGMEIRDGVAIFTPLQIEEIKRQVTWARSA